MPHGWNTIELESEAHALRVLADLCGKRWLSRGQSQCHGGLVPSIDRPPRKDLSRLEKLMLERQSIDLFRSTARSFAGPGEEEALVDDVVALMVLRHYGVPTRFLDWSLSPYVAAYFAACDHNEQDGEIWSFDEPLYEQEGKEQWVLGEPTTSDRSGDPFKFDAKLTMFLVEEPADWIICSFYPSGFPRQNAQNGAYTLTAHFGLDHAAKIALLLKDPSRYHRYVINNALKPIILRILRESHGIWHGSLFPDSAGAAAYAKHTVFPCDASSSGCSPRRMR